MFSQRLRDLRKSRKITQEELAKILGVERSTVGKYESTDVIPSPTILVNIASYFNVTVDFLLGRPEPIVPEVVAFHKNTPGEFTEEEKEEIDNFIQYILSKRDKE